MKRAALSLVAAQVLLPLTLIGVASFTDGQKQDAKTLPQVEEVSQVEKLAEKSIRDYAAKLAEVCDGQAAHADEWKSYAEVFDFGHNGEEKSRLAFEEFEELLTAEIKPADPYDPQAVRRTFGQAARGFRKAAGIKQATEKTGTKQ